MAKDNLDLAEKCEAARSAYHDAQYELDEKQENLNELLAKLEEKKNAVNRVQMAKMLAVASNDSYKQSIQTAKQFNRNGGDPE